MEIKLLIVYSNIAFVFASWNLTKVLVKKERDVGDLNIPVTQDTSEFRLMIEESIMWIDKSLIIKEIWQNNDKNVFINTSPRRWGKSTILSMILFYHQLPLNMNGSLADREKSAAFLYFTEGRITGSNHAMEMVEPPLISKEKLLNNQHLANHSIIYMNGATITISERHDYKDDVCSILATTYKRHFAVYIYLKQKLSTCDDNAEKEYILDNIRNYEKYYYNCRNLCLSELQYSISVLSNILKRTYERKVIILFDEYDGFISNIYFAELSTGTPQELVDDFIQHFYKPFMTTTFKFNLEIVARGVITGVLPIREATGLSGFNNVELKYVFGYENFFPYYGIFNEEFYDLCTKRGTNASLIKAAVARYDGYSTLSHQNYPMLSTYSVMGFINKHKVNDYWKQSSLTLCVIRLLQHEEFKKDIAKLLQGWNMEVAPFEIEYNRVTSLTLADFETISNILINRVQYESSLHSNAVLSLLISIGYVSIHPNQPISEEINGKIAITIPNLEIYHEIRGQFLRSLELDYHLIKGAALHDYMKHNDSRTLQPLAKSMSDYISRILNHRKFSDVKRSAITLSQAFSGHISGNEKTVESILMGYFLNIMSNKGTLKDYAIPKNHTILEQYKFVDEDYGQQILDIFFMDDCKTSALIVELKFVDQENQENSMNKAFQQCLRYVLFYRSFQILDIPSVRFLAARIHKNGTIELMSIIMTPAEIYYWIHEAILFHEEIEDKNLKDEELRDIWGKEMFTRLRKKTPSQIWYAKHDQLECNVSPGLPQPRPMSIRAKNQKFKPKSIFI